MLCPCGFGVPWLAKRYAHAGLEPTESPNAMPMWVWSSLARHTLCPCGFGIPWLAKRYAHAGLRYAHVGLEFLGSPNVMPMRV